jgi:surface antigen
MKRGYILLSAKIETTKKLLSHIQIIGIASAVALVTVAAPLVHAGTYDAQISQLKRQNAATKSQQQDLAVSAGSISDKIAAIQADISALEAQIQENQAKDQQLQQDIAAAETELAYQKSVLGNDIKQMYVKDDVSTLEKLASSKTLSDYVDQEQYRSIVQNKITTTMDHINALKKQLDDQRTQVQKLLVDQQAMQERLSAQKAENDRLLAMNQDQQASLNRTLQATSAKISQLQRLQAIENARYNIGKVQYGGSGGYPWASAPWPNSLPDPWGMYKRQCVSYTAWKVASTGRYMPYWGGHGNAKQWDDNARAAGIPVSGSPRVGDVAISNSGSYGHAMYVESVNSDGTITVSQYNASWDGRYSVAKRAITGLVFIHF